MMDMDTLEKALTFKILHISKNPASDLVLYKAHNWKLSWQNKLENLSEKSLKDIYKLKKIVLEEGVFKKEYKSREEAIKTIRNIYVKADLLPPSFSSFSYQNHYNCNEVNVTIIKENKGWRLQEHMSIKEKMLSHEDAELFFDTFSDVEFQSFKEAKQALIFWLKSNSISVLK